MHELLDFYYYVIRGEFVQGGGPSLIELVQFSPKEIELRNFYLKNDKTRHFSNCFSLC